MTSNAVQRPQTPGALWVVAAWARLLCSASSTMTRHRLDRRALHPGPRRSQRDLRDFHHGLLGEAPPESNAGFQPAPAVPAAIPSCHARPSVGRFQLRTWVEK